MLICCSAIVRILSLCNLVFVQIDVGCPLNLCSFALYFFCPWSPALSVYFFLSPSCQSAGSKASDKRQLPFGDRRLSGCTSYADGATVALQKLRKALNPDIFSEVELALQNYRQTGDLEVMLGILASLLSQKPTTVCLLTGKQVIIRWTHCFNLQECVFNILSCLPSRFCTICAATAPGKVWVVVR